LDTIPQSRAVRGWNPVRVIQVTVGLLPVAIAIGGAAARVVVPVAIVCGFGVVRREKLITAPTDLQRRAIQRMARVPKIAQASLAAYTLTGFAAIYSFFHGGQRLAALLAQIVIVATASAWMRSAFNRDEPVQANPAALIDPVPDPAAATSQPPPG
jgi:hypothetical protein